MNTFTEQFKTVKASWGQFKGQLKDFKNLKKVSGGGVKGYFKAVAKTNFPNLAGSKGLGSLKKAAKMENFKSASGVWGKTKGLAKDSKAILGGTWKGMKNKGKALSKDLFNTEGGGYATQIKIGVSGADEGVVNAHAHGNKKYDAATGSWSMGKNKISSRGAGVDSTIAGMTANKARLDQMQAIKKLTDARSLSSKGKEEKVKALGGGDTSSSKALVNQKATTKEVNATYKQMKKNQKKYTGWSDRKLKKQARINADKKKSVMAGKEHKELIDANNPLMNKRTKELDQMLTSRIAEEKKKLQKINGTGIDLKEAAIDTGVSLLDPKKEGFAAAASAFDPTKKTASTFLEAGKNATTMKKMKDDVFKTKGAGKQTDFAKFGKKADIVGGIQAQSKSGLTQARVITILSGIQPILDARMSSMESTGASMGKSTPKSATKMPGPVSAPAPSPVGFGGFGVGGFAGVGGRGLRRRRGAVRRRRRGQGHGTSRERARRSRHHRRDREGEGRPQGPAEGGPGDPRGRQDRGRQVPEGEGREVPQDGQGDLAGRDGPRQGEEEGRGREEEDPEVQGQDGQGSEGPQGQAEHWKEPGEEGQRAGQEGQERQRRRRSRQEEGRRAEAGEEGEVLEPLQVDRRHHRVGPPAGSGTR